MTLTLPVHLFWYFLLAYTIVSTLLTEYFHQDGEQGFDAASGRRDKRNPEGDRL